MIQLKYLAALTSSVTAMSSLNFVPRRLLAQHLAAVVGQADEGSALALLLEPLQILQFSGLPPRTLASSEARLPAFGRPCD